jgi:serine/threonine protein kinase/Tfp pilus assembly protein PilF
MSESTPSRPAADRNLLFGILALQMNFINRDVLIGAMNAWVLEKTKSLGQILTERAELDTADREFLESMVRRHLERHGNDPERSLAAVSSLASAREGLRQIQDADLHASLAKVSATRHGTDDSYPKRPPSQGDSYPTHHPSVGAPTSTGLRFRILRPHAQGGRGQVSVALDEELKREVALKEIQERYADDAESRARFVREAEITGGLEHPGIVPVYGLGTDLIGRPYYAMRFIKGDSLKAAIQRFHQSEGPTRNPGERALALRGLLGRFVDVCNAIAYAHSRGVLHRDLKPGNVMLGKYGETLVVDWGLAKALGQVEGEAGGEEGPLTPSSGDSSAPTQMGQVVGTPAYMSPEQASGRLDQLGPASDVYSLGATFYCLLTGHPPVEGLDVATLMQRVVKGEFPAPRQVKHGIAPALEAICLKAMAFQPQDRYASPRELADDIEHWLADEPVSAYREPLPARLARWGRHHRVLVASAAVLLLSGAVALSAGLVLVGQANRRTQKERDLAQRNAAKAEAINHFLVRDLLAEAAPEQNPHAKNVTVLEVLDKAARKIDAAFVDQPEVEVAIRLTVGETYRSLGRYAEAEPHLRRAVDLGHEMQGAPHLDSLRALGLLAVVLEDAGKLAEAESLFHEALDAFRNLEGPDHPDSLNAMTNLASLRKRQARLAEAEALYRQSLEAMRRVNGSDHPDTLQTLNNLALVVEDQGKRDEAEPLLREALEGRRRVSGPDHPDTLRVLNNLAMLMFKQGKLNEAGQLAGQCLEGRRRVLGAEHRETLATQTNLALIVNDQGKSAEAEALVRQSLEISRRALGPEHPDTLWTMHVLATVLQKRHQLAEAETLLRQTLEASRRVKGPNHPNTLSTLANLAGVLQAQGKLAEAEPLLRQVLEASRQTSGPEHPETLTMMHNLAGLLKAQDKLAEAEPLLRQCLEMSRRTQGPEHPSTLTKLASLADLLRQLQQLAEAESLYREALEIRRRVSGPEHEETLRLLNELGGVLRDEDKPAEAEVLSRQCVEACRRVFGPEDPRTLMTQNNLAILLQAQGKLAEAEPMFRAVLEARRKVLPPGHVEIGTTLAKLGQVLTAQDAAAEAEPLLREALEIHQKRLPKGHWQTAFTENLLGGCLTARAKYAEAEPLLQGSYDILKATPTKLYLTEALERLVQLYDAWGKPEVAQKWRKELEERRNNTPKTAK